MFRIQAPILIIPTADAQLALGVHLEDAGLAAYREIAVAAKGLEIAISSTSSVAGRSPFAREFVATASSKLRSAWATRACRRAPSPPIRCGRLRPRPAPGSAGHATDGLRGSTDHLGGGAKRASAAFSHFRPGCNAILLGSLRLCVPVCRIGASF